MPEFECASLSLVVCDEGHIHLNLSPMHAHCQGLGVALDPSDARDLALHLLQTAAEVSPPQ